jgi:isoaspartyl peptidase/L-asparaginase-like protein (Ntn-hydrolase superfamily)
VAEYWESRQDCQAAAAAAIAFLERKTDGGAGLVLVDRHGRIGYARNTGHMPVCLIDAGEVKVDV